MFRLLLALIFSVLGLFQSDAMSSVVTPPTVPKSGLHSVSDKALTTSFTPVAKVTGGERYTIVHDYLGTPVQAYDSAGNLVWKKPYYIDISQDSQIRLNQHSYNGRFNASTDTQVVLHRQIDYATARAYEQYSIEQYGTIDRMNPLANQQNSYRHNRTDSRGKAFEAEYKKRK